MKKTIALALLLVLLLGLGFTALTVVKAQTRTLTLPWSVLGSGGMGGSAGDYTFKSTLGQPLAGLTDAGDRTLISGFWMWVTDTVADFLNFIPLIFH